MRAGDKQFIVVRGVGNGGSHNQFGFREIGSRIEMPLAVGLRCSADIKAITFLESLLHFFALEMVAHRSGLLLGIHPHITFRVDNSHANTC